MKMHSISYATSFYIEFSKKDVEILLKSSEHHYDWHCKSYSQLTGCNDTPSGQGVLVGMMNCIMTAGESYEQHIKWREFDTISKIAENYLVHTEEDQKHLMGLKLAIGRAFNVARDHIVSNYTLTPGETKLTTS